MSILLTKSTYGPDLFFELGSISDSFSQTNIF